MALAAVGFAKAKRRRQIMIATSSIGPGALNMATAAGTAHANRLPVLLLSGDTFTNRLPDPVLQQVEHFGDPTVTVNDAFKAVTRYWDRITRPAQIISSLPQATAAMLAQGVERRCSGRREQGRSRIRGLEPGIASAAFPSAAIAVERKVVSLPPVTVMRPFSFRMRLSRFSFDGSTFEPDATTGRAPDQVETTSAPPSPRLGNSERAARRM